MLAPPVFFTISIIGAIAELGDTLIAVRSLSQGVQEDLSSSTHIFVRLRVLYPVVAVLLRSFLVAVAVVVLSRGPALFVRRLAMAVIILTFVQA